MTRTRMDTLKTYCLHSLLGEGFCTMQNLHVHSRNTITYVDLLYNSCFLICRCLFETFQSFEKIFLKKLSVKHAERVK